MLVKAGMALLALWALGLYVLPHGRHFHIVMLAALMLILIGVLKARDAAVAKDAAERHRSEGGS